MRFSPHTRNKLVPKSGSIVRFYRDTASYLSQKHLFENIFCGLFSDVGLQRYQALIVVLSSASFLFEIRVKKCRVEVGPPGYGAETISFSLA